MTAVHSDPIRKITDAVLYEGYVLWPYRRSALKNAQRWTFGGVYPRAHSEARAAGDDPWTMQTQCLVEGSAAARIEVGVRFLHVVWRQAHDQADRPVDSLDVGGEGYLTWEEAAEREVRCDPVALDELAADRHGPLAAGDVQLRSDGPRGLHVSIAIDEGCDEEPIVGPDKRRVGTLVRSWRGLRGGVEVRAEAIAPELHRVTVRIENTTPWVGRSREDALRRTFCSTHTVLRVEGGAFVSLTDPPSQLADAAAACENQGTWPVLAGEESDRSTVLSSPIILSDYPQIAPESPGDLFDGGEIDQLLILNLLALTDEEKAEVRASDPRTRELLDRSEALTPDQLMALHGTVRELQVRRP